MSVCIYFSDIFEIAPEVLHDYGTVDLSLVSDLPLFIDPFLLFNSDEEEFHRLHEDIIRYLVFLRDKSEAGSIQMGLLAEWFCFPEVSQLWMGYSQSGNRGSGLGMDFARKLHRNLNRVFQNFGDEQITAGSHLEKLCLIEPGVGRDHIADFTANLILDYLAQYTAAFADEHLDPRRVDSRVIRRAAFNYNTESWIARSYNLPIFENHFVLLAPRRLLTKDETWINRNDMVVQLPDVIASVENEMQRASMNNYFLQRLPRDEEPSARQKREAAEATIRHYPALVEYFIRMKEDRGDEAVSISAARVAIAEVQFIRNVRELVRALEVDSDFFAVDGTTADEARMRAMFLKDIIENKGGWRLFYVNGQPLRREADLQIAFRFTWCGTTADVSREVDDGRGPADFKISRGLDKSIIEFKLASNAKLKQNLQHQTEAYQAASDAQTGLKVIMYFNETELSRVKRILEELELAASPDIVLIDASPKESASNVA